MIATLEPNVVASETDVARYEIGEMAVSLRSDLDEVTTDFEALYGGCRQPGSGPGGIHIEVRRSARTRSWGGRYVICGDGEELWSTRRRNQILPYVEWGINWRVMATRTDYLQIHAAAMVRAGRGVVFAAKSGSGKSTLAAGLLARGWQYLSDEFALIDPDTRRVHPFPKALCIKRGSFDVVDGLGLPLWRRGHYVKVLKGRVGYLSPHHLGPDAIGQPCPVRCIILPKYVEGAQTRLRPVSRAEAAFALAEVAFNRERFGGRAVSILGELVRGAACFSLEYGQIRGACEAAESVVPAADAST